MNPPPPLRQHAVAKLLGCSTRYLRKLIDAGTLRAEKIPGGSERRIPVAELARLKGEK